MEGTISTEQLKAKLDRKDGIKLVETLSARTLSRSAHSRSDKYSSRANQGASPASIAQEGCGNHYLLHQHALTR